MDWMNRPAVAPTWSRGRAAPEFSEQLRLAAAGDDAAFESLVGPLLGRLEGYLRAQAGPAADDLRSDVLLALFQSLGRFHGDESGFRSWVFTIAHHRIVDHRRRSRVHETLEHVGQIPSAGPLPDDEAVARRGVEELQAILESLPGAQRQVLLLRTVADLSVEQTADAIGKSIGAVKLLQHRAVVTLRRRLERRESELS